ncbi:MAG: hypothetical protein ABI425_05385 [Patescibacteria group bacterium]
MTRKTLKKLPLLVLFLAMSLLAGGFVLRSKAQTQVIQIWDQNLEQIKALTEASNNDPKYREHNSQASKDLSDELCSFTTRPAEEREKAVGAIRDFLEMPTAEIKYECNDAFYDLESDRFIQAKSETYSLDKTYFIVNFVTNHIIQVEETPGTWGYKTDGTRWFSEQKTYDYSRNLSQKDAEQLARNFIARRQMALGSIDLSKLKLETGKKDVGNGQINYFFIWKGESKTVHLDPPAETCSQDLDKKAEGLYLNGNGVPCIKRYESTETPTLSIAFTNSGQLINFSNELEGQIGRARMR